MTVGHWLMTQGSKGIEYGCNTVHYVEFGKSGNLRARVVNTQWIVNQLIQTFTLRIYEMD